MDMNGMNEIHQQQQERSRHAAEAAVGTFAYLQWHNAQQANQQMQSEILRQQQITNMLLAGYTEQQVWAILDQQDNLEALKQKDGRWAAQQCIEWAAMFWSVFCWQLVFTSGYYSDPVNHSRNPGWINIPIMIIGTWGAIHKVYFLLKDGPIAMRGPLARARIQAK